MMKNLLIPLFFLFAVTCHRKTTTTVITDEELRNKNYVPAKIVLQTEIAGCGYLFALEDGKMLEPQNLADSLKQNNLRIWLKYRIEKNAVSVCMVGTIVKVEDVKLLR